VKPDAMDLDVIEARQGDHRYEVPAE